MILALFMLHVLMILHRPALLAIAALAGVARAAEFIEDGRIV
jgi:hypothetical protein